MPYNPQLRRLYADYPSIYDYTKLGPAVLGLLAPVGSSLTGTRSTLTSSRLVGTLTYSRSVRTRLRTFIRPASRSWVPARSSSSLRCTLSSSSSSP